MMLARLSLPPLLLLALTIAVACCLADDHSPAAISPEMEKLLLQLDADDFADRASAANQLATLGNEALPALERGVRSDSPEVAMRSFELLQNLLERGDETSRTAAKVSLDKLAQGSDRIAQQAKAMLEPKPEPIDPNQLPGGIRILGGRIRIMAPRAVRALPIAPAIEIATVRKAVHVSADGVKTIDVDEDGKKVKIVEDAKSGIQGEYTETKEGKEVVVKFTAKDPDELKTKHPEAFKLYQRFAGGVARTAIAATVGVRERNAGVAGAREHFEELLKKIDDQIAAVTKQLEVSNADKDGRAAVLRGKLASYDRIREAYRRQIKELADKNLAVPKKPAEPQAEAEELKVEVKEK